MMEVQIKVGKFVMNMLSTGVMIRLGYTYDNLLLGYEPQNSKIVDRHVRMYAEAIGNPDLDHAARQLAMARGNVRIAFFMETFGISYERGRALIEETNGNIKRALAILEAETR